MIPASVLGWGLQEYGVILWPIAISILGKLAYPGDRWSPVTAGAIAGFLQGGVLIVFLHKTWPGDQVRLITAGLFLLTAVAHMLFGAVIGASLLPFFGRSNSEPVAQ
jgi:hypothetical protein